MSASEMDLSIDQGTQGSWRLLTVSGEIDLYTAPKLREALSATDGGTDLAVDLRGVRFMDSMGLGVLIGARRRTVEGDGRFALVCTEGPVLRVLDVSGLTTVFEVVSTPEALSA
jgi:anti-sigma B factor antagonist